MDLVGNNVVVESEINDIKVFINLTNSTIMQIRFEAFSIFVSTLFQQNSSENGSPVGTLQILIYNLH